MKYELTTIKDVFDKVPVDRIQTCLLELAIGMACAKAVLETIGVGGSWPETSVWVDGGKGELGMEFKTAGGENVGSFKIEVGHENE